MSIIFTCKFCLFAYLLNVDFNVLLQIVSVQIQD